MPAEKRRRAEAPAIVPERGDPGQRRRDKIASLEAQINAQNGSQSPIKLHLAPPHNISSFNDAMLSFDAVDVGFSLSSDCGIHALTTPEDSTTAALPIFTCMTAASLLDIFSDVFNPFALHTSPPTPHPYLPPNLHPVRAQILIPHHPALDALRWPSVREKLICRLIRDIDDYSHGCRVHGNTAGCSPHHEMAEESWEIGSAFYRNWWFCMDNKVILMTNARRRERGETPLSLGGIGSVYN
ncbi:hypothetical protein PSV08DRAFT_370464 [Bipolaris maydis]|uniref:uncharacterized protein n=1 Tax=Cochliobolus heterostrophus TaxID=5016 RepID=UPI0024D08634|nr:hypothetical protein PSV08DRAFT_370464 [Bipolaris maydis]